MLKGAWWCLAIVASVWVLWWVYSGIPAFSQPYWVTLAAYKIMGVVAFVAMTLSVAYLAMAARKSIRVMAAITTLVASTLLTLWMGFANLFIAGSGWH
jgi:hypothetical protein